MGNEHSTEAPQSQPQPNSRSPSPSPSIMSTSTSTQRRTSTRIRCCTCPLNHSSATACQEDPRSNRYTGPLYNRQPVESSSEGGSESEAESDIKMTTELDKKRKGGVVKREKDRQPKAKKAKKEMCGCGAGHETFAECEKAGREKRLDVTMSIIIGSQGTIEVWVGKDNLKQSFIVHRELLTFHSEYFREMLTTKVKGEVKDEEETKVKDEKMQAPESDLSTFPESTPELSSDARTDSQELGFNSPSSITSQVNLFLDTAINPSNVLEDRKPTPTPVTTSPQPKITTAEIHIPEINPFHFAAFFSFLYHDSISPSVLSLQSSHPYPTLYLFGAQLLSPSFQNHILCCLSRDVQLSNGAWPSVEQARYIYDIISAYTALPLATGTGEVQMLKEFTAACLAADNPLERYKKDDSEYDAWIKLCGEKPEISVDFMKVQKKRWHDAKPWDEGMRREWMVGEREFGEKWTDEIKKRGWSELQSKAEGGCLRSQLE